MSDCKERESAAKKLTLVDLVQVNVVLAEARLLEDLGDGERGADAHELGLDAGDGRVADLGEDGEAELLRLGAAREEDSGGAVRDLSGGGAAASETGRVTRHRTRRTHLRGVASVGAARLGKHRLELGEALLGDAAADAVILGDSELALLVRLRVDPLGLDGDDLGLELARLLGSLGALERLGGERVLRLARDLVFGRDVLA